MNLRPEQINFHTILLETYLRQAKGLKQKVFVLRYIDGLDGRRIADRLRYSDWNIYKVLKTIEKEVDSS